MKKKFAVAVMVVVALIGAGLFYVYRNLGDIVRTVVSKEVPRLTFKDLSVGLHQVEIAGVKYVSGNGKSSVGVDKIVIAPELGSVFSNEFRINDVLIEAPSVKIEKRRGGDVETPASAQGDSASGKTAEAGESTSEKKKSADSRAVHIDALRLVNGRVEFIDETIGSPAARYTLGSVNVKVDDLDTAGKSGPVPFRADAAILGASAPGKVNLTGKVDRKSNSGNAQLSLKGVYLPMLEPYYRDPAVTARLEDGLLGAELVMNVIKDQYRLSGDLEVSKLKVSPGSFYGVDGEKLQRYLEQRPEPLKIRLDLSGSLKEPGSVRNGITRAVAAALVKHVGGERLEDARQKLREGDVEGAKQELKKLKKELKEMFRR